MVLPPLSRHVEAEEAGQRAVGQGEEEEGAAAVVTGVCLETVTEIGSAEGTVPPPCRRPRPAR